MAATLLADPSASSSCRCRPSSPEVDDAYSGNMPDISESERLFDVVPGIISLGSMCWSVPNISSQV
jgi:hypothetical protein